MFGEAKTSRIVSLSDARVDPEEFFGRFHALEAFKALAPSRLKNLQPKQVQQYRMRNGGIALVYDLPSPLPGDFKLSFAHGPRDIFEGHEHPGNEYMILLEGEGMRVSQFADRVNCDDCKRLENEFKVGDCVYLPPGMKHEVEFYSDWKLIAINVPSDPDLPGNDA